MKYHGHEIKVVKEDLGYHGEEDNYNKTYQIYKDGEYIQTAWSLGTAKEYIDSGYNEIYL